MAAPAIWRPPRFTGRQTLPRFGRSQLTGLLGPQGGRTTPLLTSAQRNQILGRGQASQQPPSNPYSDLISSFLNQQKADIAAESAADAAGRDAALRRLVISYGETPDFEKLGISQSAQGFLKSALDAKTRALAAQNTAEGTSVTARLEEANRIAQRRIPAALAGRGILRSGQTGADLAEQAMTHKRQGFDTLQEMLGQAEGTVSQFLNAERERQRALAQAEMEAAWRAQDVWGDSYLDSGGGDEGPVNLQGTPTGGKKKPYRFKAGRGWGASVGNTGKDKYGYSPKNPNRRGKPGYRPF